MAKPRPIKYVLGGLAFTSMKAAQTHASSILNRVPLLEPLTGDDERFVSDLFSLHEEREVKLGGHKPLYYFVRRHPDWPNRNFMVMRTDGEPVHFSIPYALRPMPRKLWFSIAARTIVDPQKWAYRDAYFASHADADGRAPCELTGERVTPQEADVHHAGDLPFRDIVANFLTERSLDPEQVTYVGTTEGVTVLSLADDAIAQDFARYHASRAVLQVVSRVAHRHLPK
jgi:hypothetical protein